MGETSRRTKSICVLEESKALLGEFFVWQLQRSDKSFHRALQE